MNMFKKYFNEKKEICSAKARTCAIWAFNLVHSVGVWRFNQLSYYQPPFLHNYPGSINIKSTKFLFLTQIVYMLQQYQKKILFKKHLIFLPQKLHFFQILKHTSISQNRTASPKQSTIYSHTKKVALLWSHFVWNFLAVWQVSW